MVPMPIVVVAVSRGPLVASKRRESRARAIAALDSPGRGMRGAFDYRIRMLPLRSVPPSVGAGGGEGIVNGAAVPGSPLSIVSTRKGHSAPLRVQVPANGAVLPEITAEGEATLCTGAPDGGV